MLSTECSPQDGDLPCHPPPQQRQQLSPPPLLKRSRGDTSTDEKKRASTCDDDELAVEEVVDLLVEPGSFPRFSLRDYVCSVRSKDIKTNWPFSQKNLQLCLKHGVKDPLPPFQPLHSVRNNKETTSVEQGINNANNLDGLKPPTSDHTRKYAPLCNNPTTVAAEIPTAITSCRSSLGEKDFASTTTTTRPQSEVVVESSSVPCTNGLSSSVAETPTLLEALTTTCPPPPQPQKGKKCRLILKLGSSSSDPNTALSEDIATNCPTALSEAMASKVCPVCKTFSSTSNTTLNVHIDQCLSVESTPKWVPESSLNRHRIKPRKTRLMSDICATAPTCTLEELDRRNGSSWAAVDHSVLPTRDPEAEVCNKEKRQRMLPIYPGDKDDNDAGAVYIDSSGTKLRILSKLNDSPSVLRVGENPTTGKTLKRGKLSKTFETDKRRLRLQKHHKYQKLAPQGNQSGSLDGCKFKIRMVQEGSSEGREHQEKKQYQPQRVKVQEKIKPMAAGLPRESVFPKRSGLSKRANCKDIRQLPGCKLHAARDLLVETNQSCHSDSSAERSCVQKSSNTFEKPMSSPGSNQRIENSIHEAQGNGFREHSPSRKRSGCPLFGEEIGDSVGRPLDSLRGNASVHDSWSPKLRKFNPTSLSNKTVKLQAGPFKNSENSSRCNKKPSWSCHESLPALRTSGLTKKPSSVSRSSIPESKSKASKRYLTSKKPQVQLSGEIDEEVAAGPSKADRPYDLMCNYNKNESSVEVTGRVSPSGSNKQEGQPAGLLKWEKSTVTKSSQSESQCSGNDMELKIVRPGMSSESFGEKSGSPEFSTSEAQFRVDNACTGPSSAISVGGMMTSLGESLHPEYHKLTNPFETHSLRSIGKYRLPLCRAEAQRGIAESSFGYGNELFLADEVTDGIISDRNTCMAAELESKLGQVNSFSEVEPIPIPGPPGSFLPSPRGMSSDDLQGNSSLTSSRVQSSQDQKELVDGDSSDSPISATSTISDPSAARSNPNYLEKVPSAESHQVQDLVSSGFLGASIEPVTKHSAQFLHTASIGVKTTFLEGDYSKPNGIIPEKGHSDFKDDHICCCSRKERTSQTVALDFQDSQLLKRRIMSTGTQMDCPSIAGTNNSNGSPEMSPFGGCSSSGLAKVPAMKSPPMRVSSDAAVRFASNGDINSACPPASSPVLRLMGKNLMVVNKDENESTRFRQPQPAIPNNCLNAHTLTCSRVRPGTSQNQGCCSFYHVVAQDLDLFRHDPHNSARMECFEKSFSKDFRGHTSFWMPSQTPIRAAPAGMSMSKHMDVSYAAYLEQQEYVTQTQPNRLDAAAAAATRDMEKVIAAPNPQHGETTSCTAISSKEIIDIDDMPDKSKADDATNHTQGLRRSQLITSFAGGSVPVTLDYKSRHIGPFFHNQSQDTSLQDQNASFCVTPSRGPTAAGPVSWGCTSESSVVLQRNPFMASPAAGPLRSAALYHPPRLS